MGRISLRLGNLQDAESYSDKALQTLAQLSAGRPDARVYRWNMALFLNQLAAVRLMAGKAEQAANDYTQALGILQQLSQDDPPNALLRRHWSEAHYGIATAHLHLNTLTTAREHYEASRQLRQQLVDDDPSNITEQTGLMLALARCGKHQDASTMARALRESHTDDAPTLFSAATGFAVCAAAAEQGDSKAADAAAGVLAEQYGKSAVETLQLAVERGYQLTAEVVLDPDLATLRDRQDMRKLLQKHGISPVPADPAHS